VATLHLKCEIWRKNGTAQRPSLPEMNEFAIRTSGPVTSSRLRKIGMLY
jgi:hypothetical protein